VQSLQSWHDGPNTFTPKHQQTATIQLCVKPRRAKNLLHSGGSLKSHNYRLLYAKRTTAYSY